MSKQQNGVNWAVVAAMKQTRLRHSRLSTLAPLPRWWNCPSFSKDDYEWKWTAPVLTHILSGTVADATFRDWWTLKEPFYAEKEQ